MASKSQIITEELGRASEYSFRPSPIRVAPVTNANISTRDGNFDQLCETFRLFAPQTKVEPETSLHSFAWHGEFATSNGLSLWRMKCNGNWSFVPPDQERGFCIVLPSAGGIEATVRDQSVAVGPGPR